MLNPFTLLTPALLDAMTKQPMFFVRQYYQRGAGKDETKNIPLLFSHYPQAGIDKERAYRHFELIKNDSYRFIYDTTKKNDLENLKKASLQPAGYRIFTNVLVKKWVTPGEIKTKVYYYLTEKFLTETSLAQESIAIHLQDLFGKLYLRISWRGTKLEVLLDEVENIYENVL
jgi:hypothetical protein